MGKSADANWGRLPALDTFIENLERIVEGRKDGTRAMPVLCYLCLR